MNDRAIIDELTRAADAQQFDAADPATALRDGMRARRRRTVRSALAATTAVAVVGALVASQVAGRTTGPSPAFGDPGDRVALVAAGGPADGYPDLVVRSSGTTYVDIEGFGWPLEGQDRVSEPNGQVSFPDISKLDAESMCLPMLNQAAPDVPDASWQHSGAWIDRFPSRAGLVASYEAEFEGRTFSAACTLPGDYSPRRRPDLARVPAPSDTAGVLGQCSYQGHVDFGAWRVAAVDRAADTLAAVLVSPEGYAARCVLSAAERQRVTQLSGTPVQQSTTSGPMLYAGARTDTLTLAGAIGAEVEGLVVSSGGTTRTVAVTGGVYAAVIPVSGSVPADDTVVTALDSEGDDVATYRVISEDPGAEGLLPIVCFTTVEIGEDGC